MDTVTPLVAIMGVVQRADDASAIYLLSAQGELCRGQMAEPHSRERLFSNLVTPHSRADGDEHFADKVTAEAIREVQSDSAKNDTAADADNYL